ncbi:MAG: hypothetical protein NVSMB47_15260 [Polyangiales bacterium]
MTVRSAGGAASSVLRGVGRWLGHHRWSLGLSALAAIAFVRLSIELRENELDAVDTRIQRIVDGWRGHVDSPMRALTDFGNGTSMATVTAIVVGLLVVTKRRRAALFVSTCALGALGLNLALKTLFHRARPEHAYELLTPSSFSFPSGHAMGSTGVLASLAIVVVVSRAPRSVRVLAVALAACGAVGVSLSRVYFGVHYPSDVAGGMLGAAAWVALVTGWLWPGALPGESTDAPSPVADEPGDEPQPPGAAT